MVWDWNFVSIPIFLGYTVLQCLGVLFITCVAIAIIVYFALMWSVTSVCNTAYKTKYVDMSLIFDDYEIDFIGSQRQPKENSNVKILDSKIDYDVLVPHPHTVVIDGSTYKFNKIVKRTLELEKIEGNDGFVIKYFVIKYAAEYIEKQSRVDTSPELSARIYHHDSDFNNDSLGSIESLINSKSVNISLPPLVLDIKYFLPANPVERIETISEILLPDFKSAYYYLSHTDITDYQPAYGEIAKVLHNYDNEAGQPVNYASVFRSSVFIMCYRLLDPGFRSMGIFATLKLCCLMMMHQTRAVSYATAKFRQIKNYDRNKSYTEFDLRYGDCDITRKLLRLKQIENLIRSFICNNLTDRKAIADIQKIFSDECSVISNEYCSATYRKINNVSPWLLSISGRFSVLYGKILVKIAGPDLTLYTGRVQNMFGMLTYLYDLNVHHTTSPEDYMDDENWDLAIDRFGEELCESTVSSSASNASNASNTSTESTDSMSNSLQELSSTISVDDIFCYENVLEEIWSYLGVMSDVDVNFFDYDFAADLKVMKEKLDELPKPNESFDFNNAFGRVWQLAIEKFSLPKRTVTSENKNAYRLLCDI